MTLQQIKYVLTISEKGSMNKAAEQLFVSQPSLSGAVKELEKELGITVFRRTGKGVEPTREGAEFLLKARELYSGYSRLLEQYSPEGIKHRFSVSSQHYSFVVKAFADTVKMYDTRHFDFSVRETTTLDVIRSVGSMKSDIGVLFMSSLNRRYINRLLAENELEFSPLVQCSACVYLAQSHPLAGQESIQFSALADYPCLSFEQEENGAFFLSEEILADRDYQRMIHVTDRATMLNLMGALNGFTLCSGIICEEINGSGYKAVPLCGEDGQGSVMELGYIHKSGVALDGIAQVFVNELKRYLRI